VRPVVAPQPRQRPFEVAARQHLVEHLDIQIALDHLDAMAT